MDTKQTILTARQIEILNLRSQGLSTLDIAVRIRTTTKNVIIIESTAHRKLEKAANTIRLVQEGGFASVVNVKTGTHLLDAVRAVLNEADLTHTKLRGNLLDLMGSIRNSAGSRISGGVLTVSLTVMLFRTGRWVVIA